MWKFQKNLQKKSDNTLIPDINTLLNYPQGILMKSIAPIALFLCILISGCVEKTALHPPKTPLDSPIAAVNAPPDKTFQKGYSEYQIGNQPAARKQFQKIIKDSPDYFPAYLAI